MEELRTRLDRWHDKLADSRCKTLFRLSDFEWRIVVMSVAFALDGEVQAQFGGHYPTFSRALSLFGNGQLGVMAPKSADSILETTRSDRLTRTTIYSCCTSHRRADFTLHSGATAYRPTPHALSLCAGANDIG